MLLFLGCSLLMMNLSVQLAFVVVFISQSVSHEDGARRNSQRYATVSKKFNNKIFIDRKRVEAQNKNIEDFEIIQNNESLWSSKSFLFAKTSTDAKLKFLKNKLSLVGLQLSDEADNNTGTVIVCGNKIE